ncbi:MAG: glycosyltransferase, partial [Oscillospiraceae bacterium]|nr:glycosyltransferase [Oscillospiraceae bacterium]
MELKHSEVPILYLVIPCYNEEEALPVTAKKLKSKMQDLIANYQISENSHVIFVNDGSKDNTWNQIELLHAEDNLFRGIKLSRLSLIHR